jgi:hypothetical protein
MKWPKVTKKESKKRNMTFKEAVVKRGTKNGWEIFEKYDKDENYNVRIKRPGETTLSYKTYHSYEYCYRVIWGWLIKESWDDDHPERKVL